MEDQERDAVTGDAFAQEPCCIYEPAAMRNTLQPTHHAGARPTAKKQASPTC